MQISLKTVKLLFLCTWIPMALSALSVGVGSVEITPEAGAPSAGYVPRERMEGTRDPLLASALFIETDSGRLAWCTVDHLGMTGDMVAEVAGRVTDLDCEVLVSSSHTHSGAGGFLPFGGFDEQLAGPFDLGLRGQVIDGCVAAIETAANSRKPAQIGIGTGFYGKNRYRGLAPKDVTPNRQVTLIKVVDQEGKPLAALFVWPCHPTTLGRDNLLFSADFVGAAREKLGFPALYVNGAQGDILPDGELEVVGKGLADEVLRLWAEIETSDELKMDIIHKPYTFAVDFPALPVDEWHSEMNLLTLNDHLFLTVGGELTTVYDQVLQKEALDRGWKSFTVAGLTNDAHGYIITPEAYAAGGTEARMSFGGPNYGPTFLGEATEAIHDVCNP